MDGLKLVFYIKILSTHGADQNTMVGEEKCEGVKERGYESKKLKYKHQIFRYPPSGTVGYEPTVAHTLPSQARTNYRTGPLLRFIPPYPCYKILL